MKTIWIYIRWTIAMTISFLAVILQELGFIIYTPISRRQDTRTRAARRRQSLKDLNFFVSLPFLLIGAMLGVEKKSKWNHNHNE